MDVGNVEMKREKIWKRMNLENVFFMFLFDKIGCTCCLHEINSLESHKNLHQKLQQICISEHDNDNVCVSML